jgi:hypothetical protein
MLKEILASGAGSVATAVFEVNCIAATDKTMVRSRTKPVSSSSVERFSLRLGEEDD